MKWARTASRVLVATCRGDGSGTGRASAAAEVPARSAQAIKAIAVVRRFMMSPELVVPAKCRYLHHPAVPPGPHRANYQSSNRRIPPLTLGSIEKPAAPPPVRSAAAKRPTPMMSLGGVTARRDALARWALLGREGGDEEVDDAAVAAGVGAFVPCRLWFVGQVLAQHTEVEAGEDDEAFCGGRLAGELTTGNGVSDHLAQLR